MIKLANPSRMLTFGFHGERSSRSVDIRLRRCTRKLLALLRKWDSSGRFLPWFEILTSPSKPTHKTRQIPRPTLTQNPCPQVTNFATQQRQTIEDNWCG